MSFGRNGKQNGNGFLNECADGCAVFVVCELLDAGVVFV